MVQIQFPGMCWLSFKYKIVLLYGDACMKGTEASPLFYTLLCQFVGRNFVCVVGMHLGILGYGGITNCGNSICVLL